MANLNRGLVLLLFLFSCSREPAKQLDSISISVPYQINTLDPHVRSALSNLSIAGNFYEPLVLMDANMKIQPCLAKSWENPDATTWVFHLRPSARFHDGKPLNAEDVVYTFQRLLQGHDLEIAGLLTNVSEVRAIDPFRVRIRTGSPVAVLPNKLSFLMIIPNGATSQILQSNINGTGPFKLKEWKKEEMIRMERNESYWGQKPCLRDIRFYLNRAPKEAAEDLVSGKSQFVQANSKKLKELLHGMKDYEILVHDNLYLKYLCYDLSRDETPYCSIKPNPFKNKLVRQAIHLGIDRQHLIRNLPDFAAAATQPIPPFIFGFNPQIPSVSSNVGEARSFLAKAGFPTGFRATLHSRQILQETAFLIKEQLQRIGIQVEVRVLTDPEFFDALDRGDVTFFLSRLAATIGDATDILEAAFHSPDAAGRYGIMNYGRYSNSELDRDIEESIGILQAEKRRLRLQQIMSMVMEDLPWIPLYYDQDVYAIRTSYFWQPRSDSHIVAQEIHCP